MCGSFRGTVETAADLRSHPFCRAGDDHPCGVPRRRPCVGGGALRGWTTTVPHPQYQVDFFGRVVLERVGGSLLWSRRVRRSNPLFGRLFRMPSLHYRVCEVAPHVVQWSARVPVCGRLIGRLAGYVECPDSPALRDQAICCASADPRHSAGIDGCSGHCVALSQSESTTDNRCPYVIMNDYTLIGTPSTRFPPVFREARISSREAEHDLGTFG